MASVGVQELRQRASELLRRVDRGETIEVTDLDQLPEPLVVPTGVELPSQVLSRLRCNER